MTSPRDEDPQPQETLESALEERAVDLYEHAPCGYLSALPDGSIVKVNRTFADWTGYAREDLVGRRFQDLLTAGGRIYHETHYAPLLRMQGSVREIALELVCADDRRLAVLVNSVVRADPAGRPLIVRTTVFDATQRRGYERELLRAREGEREARQRAERLQRLSIALAAMLETPRVAEAAVAELADALATKRVALWLVDGRRFQAGGARVQTPPTADWPGMTAEALEGVARAGSPVFRSVDDEDVSEPTAVGEDVAVALLPLTAHHEPIGVLCLVFTTARRLAGEQREFLQACAAQCSQALERAALYDGQRTVAHALQQSMLSGAPPQDPRFAAASYYMPAVKSLDVGGDWHDTFRVGADTIAVVVGDVVGRGLAAASAMGQLRSATRALAGTALGPARVLDLLHRFAETAPGAHMATISYAEIDLRSGRTRYACAGHPPPVLLQPGQAPTLLWDGRSPPLGTAGPPDSVAESHLRLAPGARLVLYTDGLVERRRGYIDAGFEELARALQAHRTTPIRELPGMLVEALHRGDEPDDDVCLLCLDFGGLAD